MKLNINADLTKADRNYYEDRGTKRPRRLIAEQIRGQRRVCLQTGRRGMVLRLGGGSEIGPSLTSDKLGYRKQSRELVGKTFAKVPEPALSV